ncbi:hypothetical protein HTZ77_18560 [Nonomuraea sp. SMC257]|uniref:PE domain-containing protein n=1 Tax=Nonomuraea montanisoli TaxID=2741721 RepID=A0A7Y6I810_9ACTN|nr:hypothetical protein [Nonomuraea montanisoli]NUW33417.1 hypothetical protein [Nonomuraea montanisoli]
MAAEQLPAAAQAAVTRVAIALLKAARAGVDADAYAELVRAQMATLHRAWTPLGVTGVDLFGALIAAQARIGAHLANLADVNGEAGRYLNELGGLAAHGTE